LRFKNYGIRFDQHRLLEFFLFCHAKCLVSRIAQTQKIKLTNAGYGVAGLLRKTLVYPTKMLYPQNLATASLLENLHRDSKTVAAKKMRVFRIAFAILFLWQAFPQYIAPIFAGVSIFCLSMRNNLFVTNLFGGSMANEGLGILAFSFDWTTISAHGNPLWYPFQTLMNSLVGYILSIGLYMGLYYSNTWDARKFPFLSPGLFSEKSSSRRYKQYNQTEILNSKWEVDDKLLQKHGLPWMATSHALGTLNSIGNHRANTDLFKV